LNGGGAFISSGSLYLTGSWLQRNTATYGAGVFDGSDNGQLFVNTSVLTGNVADLGGGGIYWQLIPPVISPGSTISANQAKFGVNVASPAQTVSAIIHPTVSGCLRSSTSLCDLSVASGCAVSVTFSVLDAYGQLVGESFVLSQQAASALPPDEGGAHVVCPVVLGQTCSSSCISGGSSVSFIANTTVQLTVGGSAGSKFCTAFGVTGGTSVLPVAPVQLAGKVTNCSVGSETLPSTCASCVPCDLGMFHLVCCSHLFLIVGLCV
jgi:hypothetical protein